MNLLNYKIGQTVKIKRRPGRYSGGPKIGDKGVITSCDSDEIHVEFSGGSEDGWFFWRCDGDQDSHHTDNECFCMLGSPYSWRKL